jgi:hypothetical protein
MYQSLLLFFCMGGRTSILALKVGQGLNVLHKSVLRECLTVIEMK